VQKFATQQTHIDAPVDTVWDLVGDPNRHPEWFPRIVEAECDGVEQGCSYRSVMKGPFGNAQETILIDHLDECGEITIRCTDTGTYMRWVLAEVRDGTFVDAEFGMEPRALQHKAFDRLAGKRYFRRWAEQSLDSLREACRRADPSRA
jgi:uncharacterized protein YndB with AHSA1/START domain